MKKKILLILSILAVTVVTIAMVLLARTEYRNVLLGTANEEKKAATTTYDASYRSSNGDSVTASFDSGNESLTFSGTGTAEFYFSNDFDYSAVKSIIVSTGITGIDMSYWTMHEYPNCTSILLYSDVKDIELNIFYNCMPSLTQISVRSDNQYFSSDGYGVLFDKNQTELLVYPKGNSRTSYSIPSTVTTIDYEAFYRDYTKAGSHGASCNLSLFIPSSVTTISHVSYGVVLGFDVKEINVSAGNQYFSSVDGVLFNKDKTKLIIYPSQKEDSTYTIPTTVTTIDTMAFNIAENLKNITIPNSVTDLGSCSFCYTGLTSITIPNSVTRIYDGMFYCNTELTSVTIPTSVTKIYEEAFSGCTKLTSVTIPKSVTYIHSSAFGKRETSTLTIYGYRGSTAESFVTSVNNPYIVFEPIRYKISLDNQGATNAGSTEVYEEEESGIYLDSDSINKMTTSSNPITKPTKTGYIFGGYYTGTNGSGTQMINENGYITSSFTNTYYTAAGTLYAKWIDNVAPIVTISRTDYNTFSWIASDNIAVTGYQITTSSTQPTSGWVTTGTLTSGTYDISTATTFYVWAIDAAGNVSSAKSITAYTLTRTQGENTTLTIKEGSSSGAAIGSTTPVLSGTTIYIAATASTGYTLSLKVDGSNFTSGNTKQITGNTAVVTSATDNSAPTVTVSRTDYNTFSWTASDNVRVTGYKITTSSTQPTSGWTETGSLTSGSYDISTGGTYYVWAKDDDGNVGNASIGAYILTRSQGANTTLTIKENSSSGATIGSTTSVLSGTTIYVEATASTGYTLVLKVAGTNFNSGTTKVISANTAVESSATSSNYTITLDNQSATSAGTASLIEKYNDGIYNGSNAMTTSSNPITKPTKTGYTFGGYYTSTNGSGTQMIDGNGYITSNFTNTYYTAAGTLYAKWTDGTAPTVTVSRSDYNTFSWTASDNVAVTGYQITTSSTAPSATATGWTTSGTLTSGTYDISTATTYYVWAKDAAGNVSDAKSITAYTLTRTQGANTTLTIKENSSSGATIGSTTSVLSGTTIYVEATASTGYTLSLTVGGSSFASGNTQQITANTAIVSSATSSNYTITLDNANATTNGTATIYEKYADGIYLESSLTNKMTTSANPITVPQRKYTVTYNYNYTGAPANGSGTATYGFNGYYDGTTQMINGTGKLTNDFTATKYTSAKTLNAKWTDGSVTLPSPTREGYTFKGWYKDVACTDANKVGDAGVAYVATADITLYAKWEINQYTLTVNPGGTTYTQNYQTTKQVNAPERKVTFNYQTSRMTNETVSAFTSWTLGGANKGAISSTSTDPTTYTYGAGNDTLTANYGAVTLLTPNRSGYQFGGWYKDSACTEANKVGDAGASYTPTASITLYAKWTANNYTLTVNPGNTRYSGGYETTKEITAPQIAVTFNYNDNNQTSNRVENATLKSWSNPTVGSISSNTDNPTTYTYGIGNGTLTASYEELSLPEATWEGHDFKGWYTAANDGTKIGDAGDSYTPTNNVTLFAQWTALEYTLTVNPGGTSITKTYGNQEDISVPGVTITYDYNMDGKDDKNITAIFKQWTLTGGANVGRINSATANPVTYTFGAGNGTLTASYQKITLENPSRAGYTFDGWFTSETEGNKIGDGNSEYEPTFTRTLYAHWTANNNTQYKVEHYLQRPDGTYLSNPYETENKTGTTDTNVTAVAKDYAGYTEDIIYEGRIPSGNLAGDGSLVLKLYYKANRNTPYTVEHYLQNLDGNGYTKDEDATENKTGITGDLTTAEPKIYPGYTSQNFNQEDIKGDESTIIKIYYNRNIDTPYTIKHYLQNLDGSYPSSPRDTEQKAGKTGAQTEAIAKEYPGFTVQDFEQEDIKGNGSTVINIYYTRDLDTPYTVEYYLQNVEDDEYTLDEEGTEEKEGKTGAYTEAEEKEYEGFTLRTLTQEEIKGDGSTVVKIYYNRNIIKVTFNNYDGTTLQEKNVRYDGNAEYTGPIPKKDKAGYTCTFTEWDTELNNITEDTEVTARFSEEIIIYTIKYNLRHEIEIRETIDENEDNDDENYEENNDENGDEYNEEELDEDEYNEDEEDEEDNASPIRSSLGRTITSVGESMGIYKKVAVEGVEFERENPTTYTVETEDFTLCNPTAQGYTFAGWRLIGEEYVEEEVTIRKGSIGNRVYETVWRLNDDTPYRVEHYIQQEDGEYPEEPDEVEELTGTTLDEITATAKEYEGYELDKEKSIVEGLIKGDGSLVLKLYYEEKAEEPEPTPDPDPDPEPDPDPDPDPEPIQQPENQTNTTNTNTNKSNVNTNTNRSTNTNATNNNRRTTSSNITTKTYSTADNTTATKTIPKTGVVNILIIISTIAVGILGIVLVIKEKKARK